MNTNHLLGRRGSAFAPVLLLALVPAAMFAGPRSSASYAVTTDTVDGGGLRSSSAAYFHDGGVGPVSGISSVAVPAETARHGYVGQLYQIQGVQIDAGGTTNLAETTSRQLNAQVLLDDG